MPSYRVPCSECQNIVEVTVAQAGSSIACKCGAQIEIPTMRELRAMVTEEPTATTKKVARRGWSQTQGVLFSIGLLTAAIAAFSSLWVVNKKNRLPTEPPILQHQDVSKYSMEDLWKGWIEISESDLSTRRRPMYLDARDQSETLNIVLYVALGATGLGLALALSSLFMGKRT